MFLSSDCVCPKFNFRTNRDQIRFFRIPCSTSKPFKKVPKVFVKSLSQLDIKQNFGKHVSVNN